MELLGNGSVSSYKEEYQDCTSKGHEAKGDENTNPVGSLSQHFGTNNRRVHVCQHLVDNISPINFDLNV